MQKEGGLRVGEKDVQLLEQTVKHNAEDIRELKKRVNYIERDISEVKADHQLTKQNMAHILETLSELKTSFRTLDNKLEKDKEEQLRAYRSATWKVAIAVISAVLLIQLGLN